MLSFIVGAFTSLFCGYLGMKIAVYSNLRTCHQSWIELNLGFETALQAGAVLGLAVVSFCLLSLLSLLFLFRLHALFGSEPSAQAQLFEALAGYGLGGSSIALFARVGGGIYTKAADIGADLSGKNEYGMAEDDPRNPACIADNVGDNVGDIAGMGADLFGSLAEATCASLVLASAALSGLSSSSSSSDSSSSSGVGVEGGVETLSEHFSGLMFPVIVSSSGLLSSFLTFCLVRRFFPVKALEDVERSLKATLFASTLLQTPLVAAAAFCFLPREFALASSTNSSISSSSSSSILSAASLLTTSHWKAMVCVLLGLWGGLGIGLTTEYNTSHSYRPVREIAVSQRLSAATGIIYGLALGYGSTLVPIASLAAAVCCAQALAGVFGVSLAALGMLSTLPVGLAIDAFGPISDNAGGIAQMAALGPEVRNRTDALDAAGNTTAAVGKGYAIGSAALVSLALFCAYTVRASIESVNVLEPWTFMGLLLGAMFPYVFSAMTMKSVGRAANEMVTECMQQFPQILEGSLEPEYRKCIEISTRASLREMLAPAALVIFSPLALGILFGKNCLAGLLAGLLVSGIQLALSMANSGGAWDNAKKYIEAGGLGAENGKGSAAHKNAVTGDTVGDPLKDTSGPSLNILIKLSAIISLIFGSLIASHFSNERGGPQAAAAATVAAAASSSNSVSSSSRSCSNSSNSRNSRLR
ncbi:H+-translocating inorganic pyrophosphatase TVP, putative [Eimeria brunetti]|uniref:H(+)-exporting diphosphatase n=1 Tax=Eimeria brunetti TaxID=51314 RepID=U6LIY4_9EIME|nr:H+-translocating inorganic pyrophosphatase TVP, putative [Eimeria brunetti]